MVKILYLMVGGSAGTLLRYGLSQWVQGHWGEVFPFGTLVANLLGCLLIGALFATVEETQLFSTEVRLMVFTGFLGALTTFSTLELEAFIMAKENHWGQMALYIVGSIVLGLLMLWISYTATRALILD